jgi:hypothetical protein
MPARGIELNPQTAIQVTSHILRTALFLLFLLYPSLSAKMLSVFNCMEVHGKHYLVADLRVVCYTTRHTTERAVGAVGLLCYAAGIPFGFYMLLHRLEAEEALPLGLGPPPVEP